MNIAESYDAIPYASTPITETDPDRLAIIGRLFGLNTASPAACRVLELGCASGGNVIPLACRHPQSQYLGIEISAGQVAEGQRLIDQLELSNITLRQGDILELDGAALGTFDYVLCHGVFSWVPRPVQEQILKLSRQVLAPQGIAYISYNTLPGWRMRGALRDLLHQATRDITDPAAKLTQAQRTLTAYLDASQELSDPATQLLRQQSLRALSAHPSYLYHEYLEPLNDPWLLSDFVAAAAAQGLAYLADCELSGLFPSTMGERIAAALEVITDPIAQEQQVDFLRHRAFRQSLLCHPLALPQREMDLEIFEKLRFYADLTPPAKVDFKRPKAQTFKRADGESLDIQHPLTKAAMLVLAEHYPQALRYPELQEAASHRVMHAGGQAHALAFEHLFGELFSLYLRQAVGASLLEGPSPQPAALPRARPLALALSRSAHPQLASFRHTTLDLDAIAARLVQLLDGHHSLEMLTARLLEDLEQGRVDFPGWKPGTSPAQRFSQVRSNVQRLLTLFGRQGILEPVEPATGSGAC